MVLVPCAGEASGGGLEADNATQRRGHPDRTSSVDAERDGAEPSADHGGGAAGGAPGDLADVVRVPRRPAHTHDTLSVREIQVAAKKVWRGVTYPWWGLMPLVPAPSSCMLVLPARTAPHARSCATHAASASHGLALPSHRVPPAHAHRHRVS